MQNLGQLSCAGARANITALLQDGFLFSGSVRDNLLGPLAQASSATSSSSPASPGNMGQGQEMQDARIWAVLRRVGVATVIDKAGGLDGDLGEQGGSLSAGERALLCLARALLRQEQQPPGSAPPTLILADEPTSSVDLQADAIVHDTLLALHQTVLCICHRLHNVPRFDLVAVLAEGLVAELGPPAELAARPGSLYARLSALSSASADVSIDVRHSLGERCVATLGG